MFRLVVAALTPALRTQVSPVVRNVAHRQLLNQVVARNFVTLNTIVAPQPKLLLHHPQLIRISDNIIKRNIIKFSHKLGKRKSEKAVTRRFYRLNWGIWIRTKCGRHKKLWRKSPPRKRRLRQHVFCNASQSWKLDKMVGPYWRKPKYFVNDPYEPYHFREEFPFTRAQPKPYFPKE